MPKSGCRIVPHHCRKTPSGRQSKHVDKRCMKKGSNGTKIRTFTVPRGCKSPAIVKLQSLARARQAKRRLDSMKKNRTSAASKISKAYKSYKQRKNSPRYSPSPPRSPPRSPPKSGKGMRIKKKTSRLIENMRR